MGLIIPILQRHHPKVKAVMCSFVKVLLLGSHRLGFEPRSWFSVESRPSTVSLDFSPSLGMDEEGTCFVSKRSRSMYREGRRRPPREGLVSAKGTRYAGGVQGAESPAKARVSFKRGTALREVGGKDAPAAHASDCLAWGAHTALFLPDVRSHQPPCKWLTGRWHEKRPSAALFLGLPALPPCAGRSERSSEPEWAEGRDTSPQGRQNCRETGGLLGFELSTALQLGLVQA